MYKTYKNTKISKRINNTYLKVIQSLVSSLYHLSAS